MKWFRRVFTILAISILSLAWYVGIIPVFGGMEKAGLRTALNLTFLPLGTKINASNTDAWTDFVFIADLTISPRRFDDLLKGREYEKDSYLKRTNQTMSPEVDGCPGFPVAEIWSIKNTPGESNGYCTIMTNSTRTRMHVAYSGD